MYVHCTYMKRDEGEGDGGTVNQKFCDIIPIEKSGRFLLSFELEEIRRGARKIKYYINLIQSQFL